MDLLTERRLRYVLALRRNRETTLLRDSDNVPELMNLHRVDTQLRRALCRSRDRRPRARVITATTAVLGFPFPGQSQLECFKQSRLNRHAVTSAACEGFPSTLSLVPSTAWQLSRIWLRLRGAFPNQFMQNSIEWVLRICAIEPLITIAATNDQFRRLQLGHLILNRSQCQKAKPRSLAGIQLFAGVREQQ